MDPSLSIPLQQLRQIFHSTINTISLKQGSRSLFGIEYLSIDTLFQQQALLIVQHCPLIKTLHVYYSSIPLNTFKILCDLPNLTNLKIFGIEEGNTIPPEICKKLEKLESFDISSDWLQVFHLMTKGEERYFPNIKRFQVMQEMTDEQIKRLKECKALREIVLQYQVKTRIVFMLAQELPHLTTFSLLESEDDFGDDECKTLSQSLVKIEKLELVYTQMSPEGILHFIPHSSTLRYLNLCNNIGINEEILPLLDTHFPSLRQLVISTFQVSEAFLNATPANLGNLETLSIENNMKSFTVSSLHKFLSHLRHLQSFCLSFHYNNKTCQTLSAHSPQLSTLSLTLGDEENINSTGCFYLSKLRGLRDVYLDYNSLGDEGLLKLIRNTCLANWSLGSNPKVSRKAKRNGHVMKFSRQMRINIQ